MKMIKRSIAFAAACTLTASVFGGCTNYDKLMETDQWKYITIAAGNTAADICDADTARLLSALPMNSDSSSFGFDIYIPDDDIKMDIFTAADSKSGAAAFDMSVTVQGKSAGLGCSSDKTGMAFSFATPGVSHAYSIPYGDLEEKLKASVFAVEDGKYSPGADTFKELEDFADRLEEELTGKHSSFDPAELIDDLTVTAEEKDVVINGETVPADVITYSLSAEALENYYVRDQLDNLRGYYDDAELAEYEQYLRDSMDISAGIQFNISKKHRLMTTELNFSGSYFDRPVNFAAGANFGADPKKSEKTSLYYNIAEEGSTYSKELRIYKPIKNGSEYSRTVECVDNGNITAGTLTYSEDAKTYSLTMNDPAGGTFGIEGSAAADSKGLTVTVDRITEDQADVLDGTTMTFTFGTEKPQMITAEKELLTLTEEEIDRIVEEVGRDIEATLDALE